MSMKKRSDRYKQQKDESNSFDRLFYWLIAGLFVVLIAIIIFIFISGGDSVEQVSDDLVQQTEESSDSAGITAKKEKSTDKNDNGDDDNRHTPVAHAIVEELDDIEDPVLNDFPHSIPFYIPKGTLRNRIVSVRSSRTALQDALRSEDKPLFEAVATKRNQSVLRTRRRESAAGREQRRDGSTIERNKEKSQLDRQPLQRTAHIDHG